ncbi:YkvA family protein [Flindersiella endophytica]
MSDSGWVILIVILSILALATLAGAIVLLVKVFRTRKLLAELGTGGNVAFWLAVVYTVFPVDLIPDPIYLDDIGVLAGTLVYLTRLVQKRRAEQPELPRVR